jgi:Spy/CpxP family protein refolding chaperone
MKKMKVVIAVFSVLALMGLTQIKSQPVAETALKAKPTEAPAVHLTRKELMEKLQLTPEQRQALRKNRAAYRKKNAELEGQLKIKKVELENEMEKPEPDPVKLDKIAEEIGDVLGHKVSEKIKAELQVEKKILTPQQVEQLKALQGKENPSAEEIL